MNVELKQTFSRVKPVCDVVMMCPTTEAIAQFVSRVGELNKDAVQELQQYLLFPLITHIKSTDIEKRYELQSRIIDAIRIVLEKVTVCSYEMCIKIETGLLSLVFDNSKPGMIAEVPEELKLSVIKCITVLMLNIDDSVRKKVLRTQVPLIAQAVFVSVHMAKLEKLKALRLSAIDSVTAHTVSHRQLTDANGHLTDVPLEALVVDVLASILPGVLAALQDAAASQPGHAVVAAAINAIHRILCLTMNDKYLQKQSTITAEDFAKMIASKRQPNPEVSSKAKPEISKRSPEWFAMAGQKLVLVTRSLAVFATHEHPRARRELASYCARLLTECHKTMQPSVPIALEILITLSKDDYAEVSEHAAAAVKCYLGAPETKQLAMDHLSDSFIAMLTSLPRVLNNVDSNRKLSAMNLLHGYMEVMCAEPARLAAALSSEEHLQRLVTALLEAAAVHTELMLLLRHTARDAPAPAPSRSPWLRLRRASGAGARRLWAAAALLGAAPPAAAVLDRLPPNAPAAVALTNAIASAPDAPPELARRMIDAYIEDSVWYLPLDVGGAEPSPAEQDTRDVTVYDPRAWTRDSVPGLYEGATETRYTGISYATPRARRAPGRCATLSEAQTNMALACLLTEGLGLMARRLRDGFQPYLLRTLCLILERVGSEYEMLHLAGTKALADVATAGEHAGVAELIRRNADYFTSQVSARLRKEWNTQSALQILSVVMEYSDASIVDCLYGIVEDVLVQSLDKYHEKNLHAYLQVFLTFITCIRKWFPKVEPPPPPPPDDNMPELEIDVLKDLMEYVKKTEEVEKLMKIDENKSAEEMYEEDQKAEEDVLDYDDKVTEESPPPPRHVTASATVLRRCLHFVPSPDPELAILALQVLDQGLPVLDGHDDVLLPLVHAAWEPLVTRFAAGETVVLRRALALLVTTAGLARDFIRQRAVADVLPHIYSFLVRSAPDSRLKDKGSAYRGSPAFRLQLSALAALASLLPALGVDSERLELALPCVTEYLSRKQPKPLQELAVSFFKTMLEYDYGATWAHLRRRAASERALRPPAAALPLAPVAGSPYRPGDKDLLANYKLIFEGVEILD